MRNWVRAVRGPMLLALTLSAVLLALFLIHPELVSPGSPFTPRP